MAAPASPANDTLLAAASPFEDLTEFAEAGDVRGMERALASIKQHLPSAKAVLGDTPKAYLDSLVTDIEEAFGNGEYRTVALLAVEAYRTLISALDESAMVVPKAVSLLDYAGFKLHVLAGADAPDWDLMQRVVQEADGFWNSIEGQIDEKGLRDAMNTAIQGMKEALSARDARLMAFAARVDLDLVDLLETYFEDHPQRP
ncbi:hypothetical protein AWN76_006290 [Rhodothermaceae bacterium RA]|nr:hypothetical protein AWN76_006290 [Rhodothermaceae bacterium RA]